jgi:hypothetical protein
MPVARCEYANRGTLSWHCFENTVKTGRHNRTVRNVREQTAIYFFAGKPFSYEVGLSARLDNGQTGSWLLISGDHEVSGSSCPKIVPHAHLSRSRRRFRSPVAD